MSWTVSRNRNRVLVKNATDKIKPVVCKVLYQYIFLSFHRCSCWSSAVLGSPGRSKNEIDMGKIDPLLYLSSDPHLEQRQAWIFGDSFGKLDFRKRREGEGEDPGGS